MTRDEFDDAVRALKDNNFTIKYIDNTTVALFDVYDDTKAPYIFINYYGYARFDNPGKDRTEFSELNSYFFLAMHKITKDIDDFFEFAEEIGEVRERERDITEMLEPTADASLEVDKALGTIGLSLEGEDFCEYDGERFTFTGEIYVDEIPVLMYLSENYHDIMAE